MIPVLEYAKTPRGYEAQMACAVARIECKIHVYEGGFISGSVELIIQDVRSTIGSHELDKSVDDAMETQRRMINRWFSQKWTAQ